MDASTTSFPQMMDDQLNSHAGWKEPSRLEASHTLVLLLILSIFSYAGLSWFMLNTFRAEATLTQRLEILTEEIDARTAQLGKLRETQQQAEGRTEQAVGDAAAAEERLATLERRLHTTENRLGLSMSSLEGVEENYRVRQAELTAADAALLKRREEVTAATRETIRLTAEVDDLKKRATAASTDLQDRESQLQTTETRLAERRDALREADTALATARDSLGKEQLALGKREIEAEALEQRLFLANSVTVINRTAALTTICPFNCAVKINFYRSWLFKNNSINGNIRQV